MKAEHIEILSCKFSKTITMAYHNKVDTLSYDVEDGDRPPHPDLKKALIPLHVEFAAAHYVLGEERENFIPDGFVITKAGDKEIKDQVKITGKIQTSHEDKVTCNSGDIPMTSKGLEDKIEALRVELWAFFFNEKTAVTQGNLPGFQSKKDAVKDASAPEEDIPVVPDVGDGE